MALAPRTVRYARQASSLWCAAAVGALMYSVRVATTVFRDLPADRVLAGRIAGRAFVGAYAISVAAAVVALVVVWMVRARGATADRWLAAVLATVGLAQLFWVAPAIQRHGVGWPGSFASLHATGGGLHMALVAIALTLAWRLVNEPGDGTEGAGALAPDASPARPLPA